MQELQHITKQARQYRGSITGVYDEATRQAVENLIGLENLEDRWPLGTNQIDPVAFKFLQKTYSPPRPRMAPRKK